MRPLDAELWVMAARRAAESGDMSRARTFFMRGCGFCNTEERVWVEYVRCEMEWLAKMESKRKGKKGVEVVPETRDEDEIRLDEESEEEDGEGEKIPGGAGEQVEVFTQGAAKTLKNPALDGAIPMALFDISTKQPFFRPSTAESFLNVISGFRNVSVQPKIFQHILDAMRSNFPEHPATCYCYIVEPVAGTSTLTPEFPRGLRVVLTRLDESLERTTDRMALSSKVVRWIDGILETDGLDDDLKTVLEYTKGRLER
jgi:U3 small nucleolar RNA-associated protein 6